MDRCGGTSSQMERIVSPSVFVDTLGFINLQAEAGVDAVMVNITLH